MERPLVERSHELLSDMMSPRAVWLVIEPIDLCKNSLLEHPFMSEVVLDVRNQPLLRWWGQLHAFLSRMTILSREIVQERDKTSHGGTRNDSQSRRTNGPDARQRPNEPEVTNQFGEEMESVATQMDRLVHPESSLKIQWWIGQVLPRWILQHSSLTKSMTSVEHRQKWTL